MIKILVPLDGSDLAEQALTHATAIAQSFESEVLLLRVLTVASDSVRSAVDSVDWQLHRRQAQAYLDRHVQELRARGIKVGAHLEEGKVAEQVLSFAHQNNVDLITMTAYGRGGIGQFERGGTVQKIISAARISVLIIHPVHGISDNRDFHYQRIMVPVDVSAGSQWALTFASAIAQVHHAELLLVHVVPEPRLPYAARMTRESRELIERMTRISGMDATRRMQELRNQLPANLEVETEIIVSKHVQYALNRIAEDKNASLVVFSAHSDEQSPDWHYGPVPEFMLTHSKQPILVFQRQGMSSVSKFRSTYLVDERADAG